MSSSSASTDIQPERVFARELHLHQHRSTSPLPRPRQYSTELSSIGSLFTHTESEHWPRVLGDLTDDENAPHSTPVTPRTIRAVPERTATANGHTYQGSPPTPTSTPPQAYLPAEEYPEFLRQHMSRGTLRDRGRRSSDVSPSRRSTTDTKAIPYRTRRGEIPMGSQQEHTAFSVRDTVPPSSVYTVDVDDAPIRQELAVSGGPWSPVTLFHTGESTDEQHPEYTVEYRGRS
ncbi:hypothetical protein NX059_007302 [Plenodomus lindquistii]|nr:hypothetical protein NX059_007302 [Plenodomus lindquistii]